MTLSQEDYELLGPLVADAIEYRRSHTDERDADDIADDEQAAAYDKLYAKIQGLAGGVTVQHSHPHGQEEEAAVTVRVTDTATVEVRVTDATGEIGAIDIDVDALVREATETSPPATWLHRTLNELGLEWDGVSWGLRGSPAPTHAAVLYEYIGRLGWWPSDAWMAETVTFTCPDSPSDDDGEPHSIIGCGHKFTMTRRQVFDESDGMIDCPACGICFHDPALSLPKLGG